MGVMERAEQEARACAQAVKMAEELINVVACTFERNVANMDDKDPFTEYTKTILDNLHQIQAHFKAMDEATSEMFLKIMLNPLVG